jgi:Family of unknown function (DUF6283)
MTQSAHRIITPCQDCPWRVISKRGVWPVDHFHDLRTGLLQTGLLQTGLLQTGLSQTTNGKMTCHHQPATNEANACQGFLEVGRARQVQAWLARVHSNDGVFIGEHSLLFPSFEAMADANGAGLFDWTAQLKAGDRVVYFRYGIAKMLLEVARVQEGIVDACTTTERYRFNSLGYELQTVIDARILPATEATLNLLSERLPRQNL